MDEERKQQALRRGEDFARWLLAPPPGAIDWRLPNWWTFFVFVWVFVISMLKPGNPVRDILFDRYYSTGIIGGSLSFLTRITTRLYADKIEQFQPGTALEAKRANEQIKSLATAINALAGSVAVAVTFKQVWESKPDYPLVVLAVGLAIWIHTGARHLLGLLKDESISTCSSTATEKSEDRSQ